jgi:hypothetical protein
MSKYAPGKRSHKILTRLAAGPETFAGLLDLFDDNRTAMRSKLYAILNALRDDGFVSHSSAEYVITQDGLDVLLALDSGHSVMTGAASLRASAA